MKILCVSGYAAWDKVSRFLMPSHHLFGIHEIVDHYESIDDTNIRGILKTSIFSDGGYVDFFLWRGGKLNIIKQILSLIKKSNEYDLIYDQLNRCSIFLGILKKTRLIKSKLLTIMHHPPYNFQLKIADSDGYIFFNNDYRALAIKAAPQKINKFFVNEWYPDVEWYKKVSIGKAIETDALFIDNGKSRRDREVLLKAADSSHIRIDYAGTENSTKGYARSYEVNLKDDIGMVHRLKRYKAIVIPIQENRKNKIGPLGLTSFLDSIALEIPVIASDNVCFAHEIITNKLGIIYSTNNYKSLSNALESFKETDFEKYRNNIIKYKVGKTIKEYSDNLIRIILKLK